MSPVRVFTVEEREALRIKMLDAGFSLIKQHGMTHTSVEKITQAADLGKSTFYNFFDSKEHFVLEIIEYQRDRMRQYFDTLLDGRDKLPVAEAKEYLKLIIFHQDSIYQYLTEADEEKLRAVMLKDGKNKPEPENHTFRTLLSHMEGVRPDVNMRVTVNLIRMMAIALYHKTELYEDALDETLSCIYDLIFSRIFSENTE
ncbi:TetR/AcrR family transcriptional regulator [Konateibacter massiliensis]|uniref:TetR/AcrR family transcriptional regulator n=1 Tax=Konateibacter massiliensis TaxID=2002841 RepID=UPI000C14BB30|nr:TetR/AcrR family transcriptional regulator [Konateibacter massiliensis]